MCQQCLSKAGRCEPMLVASPLPVGTTKRFEESGDITALENTQSLEQSKIEDIGCLFLAGGHGTCVDFVEGGTDTVTRTCAAGKVVATAVYHGCTTGLVGAKDGAEFPVNVDSASTARHIFPRHVAQAANRCAATFLFALVSRKTILVARAMSTYLHDTDSETVARPLTTRTTTTTRQTPRTPRTRCTEPSAQFRTVWPTG